MGRRRVHRLSRRACGRVASALTALVVLAAAFVLAEIYIPLGVTWLMASAIYTIRGMTA